MFFTGMPIRRSSFREVAPPDAPPLSAPFFAAGREMVAEQGADVVVLRKRDKVVTLDLYQAKNYEKPPSRASAETKSAFASLGVEYGGQGRMDGNNLVLDISPKTGSAGYSYLGTDKFISELKQHLGDEVSVEIGKRVVVFACGWDLFANGKTWKHFDFEEAEKKGVFVWSKEKLEPTISALVVAGKASEGDEGQEADADTKEDGDGKPKKRARTE